MYDAILTDYPRLEGERGDSARIQRAIDASPNGILCIPKGDYRIDRPLLIKNRCSLDMHPAARLIATEKMEFVLTYDGNGNFHELTLYDEAGEVYDNLGLFIRGGDIDGAGLASCLLLENAHHYTLSNITLHNGKNTDCAWAAIWTDDYMSSLPITSTASAPCRDLRETSVFAPISAICILPIALSLTTPSAYAITAVQTAIPAATSGEVPCRRWD